MPVGWSSDAQSAIQAGCPVKFSAHIDVEQNGTGLYGVNIIDITDYVIEPWPRLKRSSSIINQTWKVSPITLKANNCTGYFTPNYGGPSKELISNVWQRRPEGEAEPRECKLYIKVKAILADGSTEEKTRFQGMIIDLNPIIDKNEMTMEIVARDQLLDALDRLFEMGDGGTDYVEPVL